MYIPSRFAPLTSSRGSPLRDDAIVRFLMEIWDFDEMEYTFLYTRRAGTDRMAPHPVRGDRSDKIYDLLKRFPPNDHDYYFCPNSFDAPRNTKGRALPTRYAWSDIDDADPMRFRPKANILWETSTGRFQGLWIWRSAIPARDAEQYSRNLWLLYGGDKGAWSANKLLRVPGTVNHKPNRRGVRVRLLHFNHRPKPIPAAVKVTNGKRATKTVTGDIDPFKHDPIAIMRRYRRRMGLSAGTLMSAKRIIHPDRSAAVASIIAKLIELGAADDEIASVLWVNVYFNAKWPDNRQELERQIVKIRGDVEAGR